METDLDSHCPQKILWISCVGEKGGAEVYMLNLLRHLERSRFVPAVALLRPGPLGDELRGMNIAVHEFTQHRMRNVIAVTQTVRQLTGLIRSAGYDIVHSNGFRAHPYGGWAAWLSGVPEVWTVHTPERPGWLTRAILSTPTRHVVANAPRTADWFVQRGLPTSLLWPSIDAAKLARAADRETLARNHHLPAGSRWITMGARLQRYKGHEYFLRALASLPAGHEDVQGIIIGGTLFNQEPEYPGFLHRLADELGIAARVKFTGFLPDAEVAGFLAASELVMHPALDEDFGLTVAEAQALGRPVLAFASPGPAAIVKDGQTGRLVPVGDQTALNLALVTMLGQPSRLREWGEAGKTQALDRFGAVAAARQLERVYAGL